MFYNPQLYNSIFVLFMYINFKKMKRKHKIPNNSYVAGVDWSVIKEDAIDFMLDPLII